MNYWITLIIAILCEISGTLCLKRAVTNESILGFIFAMFMIAASYILFSITIKKIALGVAYAIWEGVGILIITLFSILMFNEVLTFSKIVGIILLIAGIILIKSGTAKGSGKISYG